MQTDDGAGAAGNPVPDQENKGMDTRHYLAQSQSSPRQVEALAAPEDRRWSGIVMVLLILLALVWPLATIVAAVVAFLIADRDQATVLFAAGAGFLLLHWMLGG